MAALCVAAIFVSHLDHREYGVLLLVRNGEMHGRVPRIGEKPRIDVTSERASERASDQQDMKEMTEGHEHTRKMCVCREKDGK